MESTDTSYAYSRINYYEALCDSLSRKIQKLEKDYEELTQLSGKLSELQESFGSSVTSMKQMLSESFQTGSEINALQNYRSGMLSLLDGTEYSEAVNGLSTADSIVQKRMNEIVKEVHQREGELQSAKDNLSYWYMKARTVV